jgi:hypothetical protein
MALRAIGISNKEHTHFVVNKINSLLVHFLVDIGHYWSDSGNTKDRCTSKFGKDPASGDSK